MTKRRAEICLSVELLGEQIGLPDGVEPLEIYQEPKDRALGRAWLIVGGPALTEDYNCPELMEPRRCTIDEIKVILERRRLDRQRSDAGDSRFGS